MKVLVFIEHDIICRHFISSGALSELSKAATLKFIFPDDGNKRMKLDPAKLPLDAPFERLPIDRVRQQTWRWLLFVDQLRWRAGEHEAAIRRMRRLTLGWKATALLRAAGLPIGRTIFKKVVDRRLGQHPISALSDLLDRERPDVVLHPTVLDSVFLNDLVVECRERKLPLVAAMNSWDNPSTKRSVVGKPDLLLVWGPQTKAHAQRFIGLADHEVMEFGAAQFDVFQTAPRFDRSEFCRSLGIDAAKRLILFAGSNAQTDEIGTLDRLDAEISSGTLPDVSIVYRPHPWGGGGRGGARLASKQWSNIRIDPTMNEFIQGVGRGENLISLPDYRDTHDLLCAVDAVVSPLSTILLEALLHGKQAIVFIPGGDLGSELLTGNLPFLHFSEFLHLPEIATARTSSELSARISDVRHELETSQQDKLRNAAEWFVRPFDRPWRERIVELLFDIVRRKGGAHGRASGALALDADS